MFRKSLMAAAFASSLSLGACATAGLPTADEAAATVAQVQAIAVQICGYRPVASTVLGVIASFTGAGQIIGQIDAAAQGICSAITAKGARRGGHVATFRGVAIHGQFVR